MILLVADTGPLHYLVEIEAVELLAGLVEKVVVPMPVWRELQSPNAAASVKQWMLHPPAWLEVRETPEPAEPAPPLSSTDQACSKSLEEEFYRRKQRKRRSMARNGHR